MNRTIFKQSLAADAPPAGLSLAAAALWWDAKGKWDRAHECAQEQEDKVGAWVHAYLHRKEGDLSNADYWYAQAGRSRPNATLDEEWAEIVMAIV